MYENKKNQFKIDLHGMNLKECRSCVNEAIKQAIDLKIPSVTIVTGRGIHARQENAPRGMVFKKLPLWINQMELKKHIYCVIKEVGSYLIILDENKYNNYLENENNATIAVEKKLFISSISSQHGQLIDVINSPESSKKYLNITTMMRTDPTMLEKVLYDGTTILMVAAALNKVETMKYLLKYDNSVSIKPQLLKKSREDGVNALMIAVMFENIDSINFLLNRAPSLLKMKQKNHTSIIQIAAKTSSPRRILEVLYQHLQGHHRQKGYTNLFREYKNFTEAKLIIESDSFKKYKGECGWFFYDRMSSFLSKIKGYKSIPKWRWNKKIESWKIEGDIKLKNNIIWLLKTNKTFKRLFIKFNNYKKIKPLNLLKKHSGMFYLFNQKSFNKKTLKFYKNLSKQPIMLGKSMLKSSNSNVVNNMPYLKTTDNKFAAKNKTSTIKNGNYKIVNSACTSQGRSVPNLKCGSKNRFIVQLLTKKPLLFSSSSAKYKNTTISSLKILAKNYSFECCDVSGDGNCLFHAVDAQFKLRKIFNKYEPDIIRNMVVKHIRSHKDDFAEFIDEDFDRYLEKMRVDRTWGGEPEIRAIMEIFKVNIVVFSDKQQEPIIYNDHNNELRKTIYIGHISEVHYQSLIDIASTNKFTANRRNLNKKIISRPKFTA